MKIVDTFVLYKIIRRLSTPFDQWGMFQAGIIDRDGNFIVSKDQRTDDQLKSYSYFDVLVLNLKKILSKVPGGSTRLATFAAALYLLREGDRSDLIGFESRISHLLDEAKILLQETGEIVSDIPSNNTDNIATNSGLVRFKSYKKKFKVGVVG